MAIRNSPAWVWAKKNINMDITNAHTFPFKQMETQCRSHDTGEQTYPRIHSKTSIQCAYCYQQ